MSKYTMRYYYISPINKDRTRVIKKIVDARTVSGALQKYDPINENLPTKGLLNWTATKNS
jgi:hypothetical protein